MARQPLTKMNTTELLYNTSQVRELDRCAIEDEGIPGITLMKRAAEAVVEVIQQHFPNLSRCTVLCGAGNNAGDGYLVGGLLADKGIGVQILSLAGKPAKGTDAGLAYDYAQSSSAQWGNAKDVQAALAAEQPEVLVDALLGTGVKGQVRPAYRQAIEVMNATALPVVAVDLPSGLCADTGAVLGACVQATHTVTFVGRKVGLYSNEGPERCGLVHYSSLGIAKAVYASLESPGVGLLELNSLRQALPPRRRNTHKRAEGHLLVIGGKLGMGGAALLTAEAALYAGAGLVSVATHSSNISAILARRPELMPAPVHQAEDLAPLLRQASALVIGPGLGTDGWAKTLFTAAWQTDLPMVIDADGLNLLAGGAFSQQASRHGNLVLTPHPGEAARLLDRSDIQSDRVQAVKDLQQTFGGVALLKGVGTLIAAEQGISLNPYGNPGMAVAGTGDVLAGVIGSLLAQGQPPATATCLGAALHSRAADLLVAESGERGLLAAELAPLIRTLINRKRD